MRRYLLFDSGCTVCSNLARNVESRSNDFLSAQSLTDPEMQDLLKQANPEWQWVPTLLEVKDGVCKAFTGISLRVRLLYVLGPRRSWQIARLVSRSQGTPIVRGVTRKNFFKQAGAAVAGVTGLTVFSTSPAAAKEQTGVKSVEDLPGHYARREGVAAYSKGMEKVGADLRVQFTHANPAKSGTLVADEVTHSKSSFQLVRNDNTVLSVVFDKANGWCDIEDNAGRSAHFVFTEHGVNPQSASVVEQNREDLSIGAAIQHDLEMLITPQNDISRHGNTQSCRCDLGTDVRGGGSGTSKSLACRTARGDASNKCSNCSCVGCCNYISTDCDCFCLQEDFFCSCGITGNPCQNCHPGCP